MTEEPHGTGPPVTIEITDPRRPDALSSVERYFAEVSVRFGQPVDLARYPGPPPEELQPPRGVFLVARRRDEPVGCGALTTLSPGIGYISRMWVASDARGIGLGRRILGTLEEWASVLGHRRVRLYTHRSLPEAQALYRKAGYREVPPFLEEAPFADYWFEKTLRP